MEGELGAWEAAVAERDTELQNLQVVLASPNMMHSWRLVQFLATKLQYLGVCLGGGGREEGCVSGTSGAQNSAMNFKMSRCTWCFWSAPHSRVNHRHSGELSHLPDL